METSAWPVRLGRFLPLPSPLRAPEAERRQGARRAATRRNGLDRGDRLTSVGGRMPAPHTPSPEGVPMNDTRYDIWLGIGSVILILMLVASFTAVFRAALSAH